MRRRITKVTAARVREMLLYDPQSGFFTWRQNVGSRGKIHAGTIAGYVNALGYRYIRIDGELMLAHRLVWLYVHGHLPAKYIDHANGVTGDNSLRNLRECNQSENTQNVQRARVNSSTGLLGVHIRADKNRTKRYTARIKIDGKGQYLGDFETPMEAQAAYLSAKARLHPFALPPVTRE